MKYIVLHGDGLADVPREELGGQTPLQAADTPNMDRLASVGECGLVAVPPDAPAASSDVMALSLLGYDARKMYVGPAPFEAVGSGIGVGEHDVVFRCNMVSLRQTAPGKSLPMEIKKLGPSVVMDDATVPELEDEEARELIDAINEQLGSETIQFYAGKHPRHLMVWVGGKARAVCVDPHELSGQPIADHLPSGEGAEILRKLVEASLVILSTHPVNDQRLETGLKPVNCLWLWGQGRIPQLTSLLVERHISGAIISTSAVHRGIGVCAGLETVDLDEAGSSLGTDFAFRSEAALKELGKKDLVYVHAQVPPGVTENGDVKSKVKIIEDFDQKIVGPILTGLANLGPSRILVVCENASSSGRPASPRLPSPYVMADIPLHTQGVPQPFHEAAVLAGHRAARDATKFISRLIPRA